jgi:hypothetical protein
MAIFDVVFCFYVQQDGKSTLFAAVQRGFVTITKALLSTERFDLNFAVATVRCTSLY